MKSRDTGRSILFSIVVFAVALVINYYAGVYAVERASNPVTDIVLSNIPVYNIDYLFVYGALALAVFIAYLMLRCHRDLPFVLNSISLFVIVRSVFISMTHLGPFPVHSVMDSNMLNWVSLGSDLFFSGHTGLPFLMALIYWKKVRLRVTFLICSIIFGAVVLLGHLHYSIDVAAAFFITYTIYHLSLYFFSDDYVHFSQRRVAQLP